MDHTSAEPITEQHLQNGLFRSNEAGSARPPLYFQGQVHKIRHFCRTIAALGLEEALENQGLALFFNTAKSQGFVEGWPPESVCDEPEFVPH